LVGRTVAASLNKKFGVPVNVINKPGGNTVPAVLEVYGSKPDGYTILVDCMPSSSMLAVSASRLPFEVMDRTFIGSIAGVMSVLVVPANSPHKTMDDIVAALKKNPENITWTSLGGVSLQDLVMRQLCSSIGVDIFKTKPVMSKSGAEAATLAAGGHVVLGVCSAAAAVSMINGGLVRGIAITSKARLAKLADVPTTAELGYPNVNALQWAGASGPPNMPGYIVDIWDKAFREMSTDPEFRGKLENLLLMPLYMNTKDTKSYVLNETNEIKKLWSMK
jgi:tripartite-type tricarboxylate transporter receptor subunit TctC